VKIGNVATPNSSNINTTFDVAFIYTNTMSKAWDGPWNGGYSQTISSSQNPSSGQSLCMSGSSSGIRCGGTVQNFQENGSYTCDISGSFCGFVDQWQYQQSQNPFPGGGWRQRSTGMAQRVGRNQVSCGNAPIHPQRCAGRA
jgi:hypothetical protein